MKRIILHWTAGTYKASELDKQHYHRIYEGDGEIVFGNHPIGDNASINGKIAAGKYAAHTLKCNTDSIGLSMACMAGAVEGKTNGKYPMTEKQFEAMCMDAATLCSLYNIPISDVTVLSHAEVENNLGIKQRGKWDFTVLPFKPNLKGARACGNYARQRIAYYRRPVKQTPTPRPATNNSTTQPKQTWWQWLRSFFGA